MFLSSRLAALPKHQRQRAFYSTLSSEAEQVRVTSLFIVAQAPRLCGFTVSNQKVLRTLSR